MNRILRLLCTICLAFVLAGFEGSSDILDRVETALKSGDYSEALNLARGAVAVTPLDYEAHALLGLALLHWGDIAAAEEAFSFSLDVNPGCADAHLGRGRIDAAFGRFETAIEHLKIATASKRFRADALLLLGSVYVDQGIPGAALQAVEIAAKEIDYPSPRDIQIVRDLAEYYRFLGNEKLLVVPEPFQKTTITAIPLGNDSAKGSPIGTGVKINGREAGVFLIDTACPGYLLISEKCREFAGLEEGGQFPVACLEKDGEQIAKGSLINQLDLGGLSVGRVPAAVLNNLEFPEGADGIVGMAFLRHFNFTMDFQGQYLRIYRADRADMLDREIDKSRVATRVPLFSLPMPIISISVNDRELVPFVLSCSTAETIIDAGYFQRNIEPASDQDEAGISKLGTEERLARQGRVNSLSLGDIRLSNVDIIIKDLEPLERMTRQRIVGIISRDILANYRIHFDKSRSELILEEPK